MRSDSDPKRELLRHALATLAYRGGKAMHNAPANFADYRCSETSRTPEQILAHIGDWLDWGLSIAREKQTWRDSGVHNWDQDVERFVRGGTACDDFLASDQPLHGCPEERSWNANNAKDKFCGEHIKRWYYTTDVVEQACGDAEKTWGKDAEVYRCEHCKTLYLPHPEAVRGLNVAGQGQTSIFGLTVA